MKVFRVRPDVNNYQYFMLNDPALGLTDMMKFDCKTKAATWVAPEVHILRPHLKKGSFSDLWTTPTIVVNETTLEQLRDLLEMSGELLPLSYQGELFYIVNVTECFNVLDRNKTKWRYAKGQLPVDKYEFFQTRFCESPLFKIPETCGCELLTIEGIKAPEDEFKGRVEKMGMQGLLFEEIWRSL